MFFKATTILSALVVTALAVPHVLDRSNTDDVAAYEAAVAQWKVENNYTESAIGKRDARFSIFTCENPEWVNPCWYHEFASTEFNQVHDGPPSTWGLPVNSFGPGTNTFLVLYDANNVPSNTITYPGFASISYWPNAVTHWRPTWAA